MPVHMTALEAIDVADHVLTQFGEQERQRAAERVASTAERIARMSETEFKDSRTPCALLDDRGRCTVYEVRPLACRGFHSTSVDVCRASFDSNDTACDAARDRVTEDLCARLVVAMHAISRAGELGSLRFELHSALTRLLGPGRTGSTQEVVQALEGVRSRPSPLDVPLEAVIARLRDA